MKTFSILADSAQIDQKQKVHALGINWTHMPSPALEMTIITFVEVPPDELPAALAVKLELRDSEDQPVTLSPPDGSTPIPVLARSTGTAEPLEPSRQWEPVRLPFVAQIGPGLPLEPGNYKFVITVERAGGDTQSDELRFRVRKPGD